MGDRRGPVEGLVTDSAFWRDRRVFLTGHTGFKGAWTALLLRSLGARVHGYALAPDSDDGVFNVARVADDVVHRVGDVRDRSALAAAMGEAVPQVVIHMAAQALVRQSYADPVTTFE